MDLILTRLSNIDEKLEQINSCVSNLENKLDKLDSRVKHLEDDGSKTTDKIKQLEVGLTELNTQVNDRVKDRQWRNQKGMHGEM